VLDKRTSDTNLIGMAGDLRQIRHPATQLLIATYADPVVGRLHEVVPIAGRTFEASNDPLFKGNIKG